MSLTQPVLSFPEFYAAAHEASGVQLSRPDLSKTASAFKVPELQAKLASVAYWKSIEDGVQYEDGTRADGEKVSAATQRAVDAMAIASAYLDHLKAAEKSAALLANGAMFAMRKAAEDFAKSAGVSLTADEVMEMARLQRESEKTIEGIVKQAGADLTVPGSDGIGDTLKKHAPWAVPTALLGAGAAYWLNKRRNEAEESQKRLGA